MAFKCTSSYRAGVAVAVMLAPPPTAAGGYDSLSAAEQSRQRSQEHLLRLNDRVYDATSATYDQQLAGARLDVNRNALNIY